MTGIIAAGFAFSTVTAHAQCNGIDWPGCGSKTLSACGDFFCTYDITCTAAGSHYFTYKDAPSGYDGIAPISQTCDWSCTAYDLSGHGHKLSDSSNKDDHVPDSNSGKCHLGA